MIYRNLKTLVIMIATLGLILPVHADSLGTLYTTSKDRQKLEKIRNKKEEKRIEVIETKEEKSEELIVKKVVISRDPVSLKGIVYRSTGKSTAWVNEGNTFEGNIDSEFISVPSDRIETDQITVIMPDDNAEFKIKVGEVYTPAPIEQEYIESEVRQPD